MARIRLLPKAHEDLEDIWRYTAEQWGVDQAIKYTGNINNAFQLLANEPLICRERGEFNPPVRMYHQGSHLVIYLNDDLGIIVVRILHENMDVQAQLETDT